MTAEGRARCRAGPLLFVLALVTVDGVGAAEPRAFYAEDIKAATERYIAGQGRDDGVFPLVDDKTGEDLALRFVTIHDPVRAIDKTT